MRNTKVERDKNGITLQWEEPRDIYKVILKTSHPSELLNNKNSVLAQQLASETDTQR